MAKLLPYPQAGFKRREWAKTMNDDPAETPQDTSPRSKDLRATPSAALRQKARLGEALRANLKRRKRKSVEGPDETVGRNRAEKEG